jgi:hypothetical protein
MIRPIRRLVELGLTVRTRSEPSERQRTAIADLASQAIDSLTAGAPNNDEKASRKRRLIKGPERRVATGFYEDFRLAPSDLLDTSQSEEPANSCLAAVSADDAGANLDLDDTPYQIRHLGGWRGWLPGFLRLTFPEASFPAGRTTSGNPKWASKPPGRHFGVA